MVADNLHARVEGSARQLHSANILLLCLYVLPLFVLLPLHCCCRQYKVYDMTADYRLLFTLPAAGVGDIKLSPQYLLLLQCGTQQQPFTAPSPPLLPQTTTDTSPAGSVSPHSKATAAAAAAKPQTGQQLAAAGRVVVVGQQCPGQDSTPDLEKQQQQEEEGHLNRHVHAMGISLLLVVYAAANGQVGEAGVQLHTYACTAAGCSCVGRSLCSSGCWSLPPVPPELGVSVCAPAPCACADSRALACLCHTTTACTKLTLLHVLPPACVCLSVPHLHCVAVSSPEPPVAPPPACACCRLWRSTGWCALVPRGVAPHPPLMCWSCVGTGCCSSCR